MASEKFLYIVDHYVPFPSSEYGGIWNVIASNNEECFDLIVQYEGGNTFITHYSKLKENIQKADCFQISDSEQSRVVVSFLT